MFASPTHLHPSAPPAHVPVDAATPLASRHRTAWQTDRDVYVDPTPAPEPTVLPPVAAPQKSFFGRLWGRVRGGWDRVTRAARWVGERSIIIRGARATGRAAKRMLSRLVPQPLLRAWQTVPGWLRRPLRSALVDLPLAALHISAHAVYLALGAVILAEVALGAGIRAIGRRLAPRLMPLVDRVRGQPVGARAQAVTFFLRLRAAQNDASAPLDLAALQAAAHGLRHVDRGRLPRLLASIAASQRSVPGQPLTLAQVLRVVGPAEEGAAGPYAGATAAENVQLGEQLLAAGHPAAAAQYLRLAPTSPHNQQLLWRAARDGGDLALLEELLDSYAEVATPQMLHDFGSAVLRRTPARPAPLPVRQRALEALREAHVAAPAEVRYGRTWALAALAEAGLEQDRREAVALLRAACHADDPEVQVALGAAAVHGTAPDAQQQRCAQQHLAHAVARGAPLPSTLAALADALAATPDTRNLARAHYAQALAAAPDQVTARIGLARLELAAGQVARAMPHFAQVLGVEPCNASARTGYAACLLALDLRLAHAVVLGQTVRAESPPPVQGDVA